MKHTIKWGIIYFFVCLLGFTIGGLISKVIPEPYNIFIILSMAFSVILAALHVPKR